MLRYLPLLAWKWPMKCTMVFSSSAAALPGRREWAGGQPAVALTLGNILIILKQFFSERRIWLKKDQNSDDKQQLFTLWSFRFSVCFISDNSIKVRPLRVLASHFNFYRKASKLGNSYHIVLYFWLREPLARAILEINKCRFIFIMNQFWTQPS